MIPKQEHEAFAPHGWKITMSAYTTRKKFYARAVAIQNALRKAEAAHPRENAPKVGQIRSLGLIGKEDETKSILSAS
ncbi:hypothetical protein A1O1_05973 [Capronia coronata CBS 617.96]|uniref:Uncharacterized protein n=1 Tax=Capronia coronata CBS 617.96 TaxID=1182541 RepID=W9XYI8_9EURO|nr:uncharacterized protein A1O1_05973 [Capronia coronata CBS 617.96]EXJ85607.1 hypothetical protein A1O1_05973 [Capronia coronata CBS 617.96]